MPGEPMVKASDYSAMVARAERAEALVGKMWKLMQGMHDCIFKTPAPNDDDLYYDGWMQVRALLADPTGQQIAEEWRALNHLFTVASRVPGYLELTEACIAVERARQRGA